MYHYFKHKGHSVTGLARTESKYTDIIFDTFSKENLLQLFALIDKKHPYIIINCIGCLVQESNNNPEQAIYLNSYFPHLLEMMTKGTKNKVIHLSTDCIFSGTDNLNVIYNIGYAESTFPTETNYYGKSKALGELNNDKDLTLRQSIIGPAPQTSNKGLFNWILTETSPMVSGWSTAFWNGITTLELAKQIEAILLISPQLNGIVSLVPPSITTKYDLIKKIVNIWDLSLMVIDDTSHPRTYKVLQSLRDDAPIIKADYDKQLKELHKYMNKYNIKPGNLT